MLDDDLDKHERIEAAFAATGNLVVARAFKVFDLLDLHDAGELTAGNLDVAFIDSQIGVGTGGGKEAIRFLHQIGIARRNTNPSASKIVTVGISSNPEWALEVGDYSEALGQPLIVD